MCVYHKWVLTFLLRWIISQIAINKILDRVTYTCTISSAQFHCVVFKMSVIIIAAEEIVSTIKFTNILAKWINYFSQVDWKIHWALARTASPSNACQGIGTVTTELHDHAEHHRAFNTIVQYTALNSPSLIFAQWKPETDLPRLEFAHTQTFFHNPLYTIQLAQF